MKKTELSDGNAPQVQMEPIENQIVIYQPNETVRLDVRLENETVWLNRHQMAQLFGRDVKTIGKHIANALSEELSSSSVVADFATTQRQQNPTSAKFAQVEVTQNPNVANFATVQQGTLPYRRVAQRPRLQVLRLHETRPRRHPPHQENGFSPHP